MDLAPSGRGCSELLLTNFKFILLQSRYYLIGIPINDGIPINFASPITIVPKDPIIIQKRIPANPNIIHLRSFVFLCGSFVKKYNIEQIIPIGIPIIAQSNPRIPTKLKILTKISRMIFIVTLYLNPLGKKVL